MFPKVVVLAAELPYFQSWPCTMSAPAPAPAPAQDLDDLIMDVGWSALQIRCGLVFTRNQSAAANALVQSGKAESEAQALQLMWDKCWEVIEKEANYDSHQHTNILLQNFPRSSPKWFLAHKFPPGSLVGSIFEWPLSNRDQELLMACHNKRGVYPILGVHPREACRVKCDDLLTLMNSIQSGTEAAAIGESGLCVKKVEKGVDLRSQEQLFRIHALMAKASGLPLVLHLRPWHKSKEEPVSMAVRVLTECGLSTEHSINIHCWTGSFAQAEQFLASFPNTYFGFGKKLNKEDVRETARKISSSRILAESDAPFMANSGDTSKFIQHLAQIKGIDVLPLLHQLRSNMKTFFKSVQQADQPVWTQVKEEVEVYGRRISKPDLPAIHRLASRHLGKS